MLTKPVNILNRHITFYNSNDAKKMCKVNTFMPLQANSFGVFFNNNNNNSNNNNNNTVATGYNDL